MDEKENIYREKEPKNKGPKELPQVDLTMAQARARTVRHGVMFVLLMLVVLGVAVWVFLSQEKEMERVEKEAEEQGLELPTGLTRARPEEKLTALAVIEEDDLSEPLEFEDTGSPTIDPLKMADAMAAMRTADEYLKAKEWDAAERHARKALELCPDMNAALRLVGVIYTQRGQFDQAIAILEHALNSNPYNAETFNNLATAYMHRGEMSKAEELLLTSVEIRPDYIVGHLNLGLLYLATGQYESAIEYLERAQARLPNDMTVRNNLAVCYLRLGQYDEAREQLQALMAFSPETAPAYFNMAITYTLEKRYPEALDWIDRGAQYCSPSELQNYLSDSDFDSLRGHPEFQSVMKDLYPEMPPPPQ